MYLFPAKAEQDNNLLLVLALRLSPRVLPTGIHTCCGLHSVVTWLIILPFNIAQMYRTNPKLMMAGCVLVEEHTT